MNVNIGRKVFVGNSTEFKPIPPGEYSSPIQLNPDSIFNYSHLILADQVTGDLLSTANLADISTIANVNGVPTGPPANEGFGYANWDGLKNDRYNHPLAYTIIDLEGVYHMDYAYIWYDQTNATLWGFNIFTSRDGDTWIPAMNQTNFGSSSLWRKIDFLEAAKGGVRYIKFGSTYDAITYRGLVFYGRNASVDIIQGKKAKKFISHRNMNKSIGTNAFLFDRADMLRKVSEHTRLYMEFDWHLGADFKRQGQGEGKSPDDISMQFETGAMGNLDQRIQGYANTEQEMLWSFLHPPAYLRNIFVSDAYSTKPIDPGKNFRSLTDTTNPNNYSHMSRIAYHLAARYGGNVNADVSMLKLDPGETMKVGLGVLKSIDPGNEWDAHWFGDRWFNPQEAAAFQSALYDGHMGTMGPGFGVKKADPAMKLTTFGFANSSDPSYLKEMLLWFDAHRGVGNYPIDVLNLHHYNASGGSNQILDGQQGSHGIQPEKGAQIELSKKWTDFRDIFLPWCEIWMTEAGYTEQFGGPISPDSPDIMTRKLFKSWWLVRMMLVYKATNIDVAEQYWFSNVGMRRVSELDQSIPDFRLFTSNQYVDINTEHNSFWGHTPLEAYWYMVQFRTATEGYSLEHIIIENGLVSTNETIFITQDERLWAVAFKDRTTGETAICAWLNTAGYETLEVQINIPETTVEIVEIADAHIRQGDNPLTTIASNTGGVVTITISECPLLIKTSNLGTKKPIPVADIKQQLQSSGDVLVVWRDRNVERFTVQVQRSTTLNGTYTTIFQGVLNGAHYVDTTAVLGTTYYYKVNLLP